MEGSKSILESSQLGQQEQRKKLAKKQRNRHSSRTLRAKKKQQQQQLEHTVADLQKELQQKQQKLVAIESRISSFLIRNQMNNSFNHEQSQKYQELEDLCNLDDGSQQDQINLLLDVLINRIGVTGKQRNRKVEYYSNKLINFSFPALYRYLLKSSYQKADFYGFHQYKWTKSLGQSLNLTQTQIEKFNDIQKHLQNQYEKIAFDVEEFRNTKSQLYDVSVEIEEEVLQWRTLLTPRQCGRFISQMQKRKYNEYMELAQQTDKTRKVRKTQ